MPADGTWTGPLIVGGFGGEQAAIQQSGQGYGRNLGVGASGGRGDVDTRVSLSTLGRLRGALFRGVAQAQRSSTERTPDKQALLSPANLI